MMISFQTYLHCLILLTTSTFFSDNLRLLLLLLYSVHMYLQMIETDLETGLLYASTLSSSHSKALLRQAVSSFLAAATLTTTSASDSDPAHDGVADPALLYILSYIQRQSSEPAITSVGEYLFPDPSTDLAFDDRILERVEEACRAVLDAETADAVEDTNAFMVFEDRETYGGAEEDGEL